MEDLLASDLALLWVACSSTLGDSDRGSALLTALREREVPTRVLSERDFAPLALTESPQGILAVVGIPSVRLEDIDLNSAPAVVLMLDAVQDPGNFGTLTRSAEALGAACVVALGGTVDPWNPKAVRSAAGSSFRLPVVQSDWTAASEYLRDERFALYGAAVEGRPVGEVRGERVAIVVGNEGAGLSGAVQATVDDLVGVPLRGRAESLNVAAAAAILLYELTR